MFDVSILIDLHILFFFQKSLYFPYQKLKKQPSFEKFVLAMLLLSRMPRDHKVRWI